MTRKILDGSTPFKQGQHSLDLTICDFWAWAMSRLLSDGPRGDLAEFIVGMALGSDLTIPQRGWGEYDILYRDKKVEVKCSSVIQEWLRDTPSRPVFSIAKTMPSNGEERDGEFFFVNRREPGVPKRRSDVYVFCLFAEADRSKADPVNLDQWQFFVVPTSILDEKTGDQRQISLQGLERIGTVPCGYSDLRASIDKALGLA